MREGVSESEAQIREERGEKKRKASEVKKEGNTWR